MHLHSRRKEFVARQKHFALCSVALFLLVVVLALGLDWIIAVLLTIATRRNLRYAQMDSSSFQEWKFPYEILIAAFIILPTTFFLFVHVLYDELSFKSGPRRRTESSERHQTQEGVNAITAPEETTVEPGLLLDIGSVIDDTVTASPADGNPVIPHAVNNTPSDGTMAMLPEVLFQESPWLTEAVSDLRAVAGYDQTPPKPSQDLWAVAGYDQTPPKPSQDLRAVAGYDQTPPKPSHTATMDDFQDPDDLLASFPVLTPTRAAAVGNAQAPETPQADNPALIHHQRHGRNIFPVRDPGRDPWSQDAGAASSRASKARMLIGPLGATSDGAFGEIEEDEGLALICPSPPRRRRKGKQPARNRSPSPPRRRRSGKQPAWIRALALQAASNAQDAGRASSNAVGLRLAPTPGANPRRDMRAGLIDQSMVVRRDDRSRTPRRNDQSMVVRRDDRSRTPRGIDSSPSPPPDKSSLRRSYKQFLFQTAMTWPNRPSAALWISLIMLDNEDDDQARCSLVPERIERDWQNYEYYVRYRESRDPTQHFPVYGASRWRDLDLLKLWVNSNMHLYNSWPPGYIPRYPDVAARDDQSSIFSDDLASVSSDLLASSADDEWADPWPWG